MHTLYPFITTCFMMISAILVAIGWRLIILHKRQAHKRAMLWAAACALLFFVFYVSRIVFFGSKQFNGPETMKTVYFVFLIFHITLSTISGLFGLITLNHAFRSRFETHKRIGRITSVMWFATAATGVTVYLLLYIIFPGGDVTNLYDAIFSF